MTALLNRRKAVSPVEAVWDVYTDVGTWPVWSHDIERADLDGQPFAAGMGGTVKFRGLPSARFWVTGVDAPRRYVTWVDFRLARLRFARVIFDHRLERLDEGTQIQEELRFGGLLGWLLALVERRRVKRNWKVAIARLDVEAARRAPPR
jgi:polyketide cyclase/dehydrase/lipid transport protein